MPSVREIANYAGVSKATVSLVLNNKPGVSEAMRQRVLEARAALETHAAHAAPERGPLSVVFLHPPWMSPSEFFAPLLAGVQAGADTFQVQLRLVSLTNADDPSLLSHMYFFDPRLRPDGVLLADAEMEQAFTPDLREMGIPAVLVGQPSPDPAVAVVSPDEVEAGYQAVCHLLDLGHRRIAFLSHLPEAYWSRLRLQGYRRALADRGITPLDHWIVVNRDPAVVARAAMDCQDITAVVFANGAIAVRALPAFKAAGRVIPDTLSVIVFDDIQAAQTYDPPLTTVAYPLYSEGFWAFKMLLDQIHEPSIRNFTITFGTTLIDRESCTQPPAHEEV